MKITAIGIKFGEPIKVVYEDDHFTFNEQEDPFFENDIKLMIELGEHGYSPISGYDGIVEGILRNRFFDEPTLNVDVEGYEPDYEGDEGSIY